MNERNNSETVQDTRSKGMLVGNKLILGLVGHLSCDIAIDELLLGFDEHSQDVISR